MIIGIGTDISQITRFEAMLDRLGDNLVNKHFHSREKAAFQDTMPEQKPAFMAKRFAAKEAFAKALGTGIAKGIYLKDIEVYNDNLGKPYLRLHNAVLKQLEKQTPKGYESNIHLSLSDDGDYAIAYVIIEVHETQY